MQLALPNGVKDSTPPLADAMDWQAIPPSSSLSQASGSLQALRRNEPSSSQQAVSPPPNTIANLNLAKDPETLLNAMQKDDVFLRQVMSSALWKRKAFMVQEPLESNADISELNVQKYKFQPNTALLKKDPETGELSRTFKTYERSPVAYRITLRQANINNTMTETYQYFEITRLAGDDAVDDADVVPDIYLNTYLTDKAVPILAALDTDLLFGEPRGAMLIPPSKTLRQIMRTLEPSYRRGIEPYNTFGGFEVRKNMEEFCGIGSMMPLSVHEKKKLKGEDKTSGDSLWEKYCGFVEETESEEEEALEGYEPGKSGGKIDFEETLDRNGYPSQNTRSDGEVGVQNVLADIMGWSKK